VLIACTDDLIGVNGMTSEMTKGDTARQYHHQQPVVKFRRSSTESDSRSRQQFLCVFCTRNSHLCDPLRACYPAVRSMLTRKSPWVRGWLGLRCRIIRCK